MAVPYIWMRGRRMTPPVREALLAAEKRAGFQFIVTQGGFNNGGVAASAGTHDGDGLDFRTWHLTRAQVATMIECLRWAGFAAWYRTTGTAHYGVRAHGFSSRHVHAVPNGWGLPSAGAKRQADQYRQGLDGLAGRGKDAGGPGHVSTWYRQTKPRTREDVRLPSTSKPAPAKPSAPKLDPLEEFILSTPEARLRQIVRSEIRSELSTNDGPGILARKYNRYAGDRTPVTVSHAIFSADANSLHTLAIVRDLAKSSGVDVDEKALAKHVADILSPVVRDVVMDGVKAGGSPEAVADAVLSRLGAAIMEG